MKRKIKRILCPIDFNDASLNAIAYSASLAKVLDASLTIWNIREVPIIEEMSSVKGRYLDFKQKEEDLKNILQDWCEEIKEEHGIVCGYTVRPNSMNLRQTINHYTDGSNYDLIVLGTNGKDDNYQLFFETRGHQLIKDIHCPMLIVPEQWRYDSIDSIVFASDFEERKQSLPLDFMRTFQSQLTLLQLGEPTGSVDQLIDTESLEGEESEILQDNIKNWEDAESLFKWLSERNDDLLVLHTKHRNWVEDTFHQLLNDKPHNVSLPAMIYFVEAKQFNKEKASKESIGA